MKEVIMRTTIAGPGGNVAAGKRGRFSNVFAAHLVRIGAAEYAPSRKRKEAIPPEVADPEQLGDHIDKLEKADEDLEAKKGRQAKREAAALDSAPEDTSEPAAKPKARKAKPKAVGG